VGGKEAIILGKQKSGKEIKSKTVLLGKRIGRGNTADRENSKRLCKRE